MISPSSTTNTIVFLSVHDIPFVLCPLILHTKVVTGTASAGKAAVPNTFLFINDLKKFYKKIIMFAEEIFIYCYNFNPIRVNEKCIIKIKCIGIQV